MITSSEDEICSSIEIKVSISVKFTKVVNKLLVDDLQKGHVGDFFIQFTIQSTWYTPFLQQFTRIN